MFTPEEQAIAEDKLVEVLAEAIYLLARQEAKNKYEPSIRQPVSHD